MDNLEYLKLLPDNCVDLVVTDPPYNVSQSNINLNGRTITKDFGAWDYGFDPEPVLKELKRVLKPHGQIYVFCSTHQIPIYMSIFNRNWFFRNILVWYKRNPAPRINKSNFVFANEYIIYAINEKVKTNQITFNFAGQNKMHNLFATAALQGQERLRDSAGKSLHPTQKPLEVLKRLIEISSNPGDIVLDVFMGVGSTAVAAIETGRRFMGCDIDPNYVKASLERIKVFKIAQTN